MRIIILSVSDQIYSTNRLVEEAEELGHIVTVVNHTKCSILIGRGKRQIIFEGKNIINDADAIIPRIGSSVFKHGAAIVKEFEMNGVFSIATSLGIARAQNKVRTLQIMNRKNIPIPKTIFSISPDNVSEQIDLLGGAPVIIKLQEGTQGLGVILADSKKSATSIMDTFYNMEASILMQEFIEESNGEDLRVIVAGNKIIASMKRIGNSDDFRSNIHRGGTAEIVNLTNKEKKIALKAAKYLGLPVCGIDLIRSSRGALLIEANSTPGLQGIEAYTKINVAYAIIKYIEKNVRKIF